MDRYYCYALSLDAVIIDAVGSHSFDPGTGVMRPAFDGMVDPKFAFVPTAAPAIAATTQSVKTALDGLNTVSGDPMGGKALAAGDPLIMFMQKQEDKGTRSGATSHVKATFADGLVIPTTLSANNDNAATLGLTGVILDGGETFADDQSLDGTVAPDELFFAGPAKLNNVALSGVQSVAINFGINLETLREAGSAAPAFVGIKTRTPVITITTTQADLYSTYRNGVAISAATHVYLRKGDGLGGRVADATEAHLKFTVNAGTIIAKPIGGNEQLLSLEIHPIYNGTNALIVYTTGAIT